jgi:hypothetical protein
MRIPQVLVPLLSLLAAACISLPEIEPGPPSGDGGSSSDGGVDQVPPSIIRTMPPSSATGVPLDSTVEVDFSEEMLASTLRLSSTPPVSFSLSSWTPETHHAVFSASSPFAQGTQYTVSVEGQDLASNALAGIHSFSFKTAGAGPDTTPPTLVDSSPSDGAFGVPRESTLKLTFSKPMNRASVERAFSITSPTNSNAGSFSWNPEGTEAVFDPSTDFPYGTVVRWSLANDAADLTGNTLMAISRYFRVINQGTATISPEYGNEGLIYDTNQFSNIIPWPIGDDPNNKTFRVGISFPLLELDGQLTRITGAILTWPYISPCGDSSCSGFSSLGPFVVEPISYGGNFSPANVWSTPSIGAPLLIESENALGIDSGNCRVSVLSMVLDAWNNRSSRGPRAQFRLRFDTLTNNDSRVDTLVIRESDLKLEVTYEVP